MVLKKLEVLGFKSFAKKTELFFDVPMTAIVGPNGSGKSNVAEAFQWALGEQSMKSLRGKRGEDLIFNGSAGAPRQNHAYVSVVFDNKDKKFNIDFGEVEISRHVYRDGANQYFINGSQVRLKDIIELLSAVSLGVSSHHIISQGEADRILNANIYERREMIEDALGLRTYQYKKLESERKLEKTVENLKQVESLRRELAPHLKFLKKQVEQVERAEEMRRELFNLYVEYLYREEFYLKSFKSQIEKEKFGPLEGLKNVEKEISRLSALVNSPDVSGSEKFSRLTTLETDLQSVRRKKDELARKIGRLEGVISVNPLREMIDDGMRGEKRCPYCGQTISVKRENEPGAFFLKKNEDEMKKHQLEKAGVEIGLSDLEEKERKLIAAYTDIKSQIDKQKDSLRDSERILYELRTKRSEIVSALGLLKSKEEKLNYEEGAFKMELTEAATLVGRQVLSEYKNFPNQGGASGAAPVRSLTQGGFAPDAAPDAPGALIETRRLQEDRRKKIERIKIRLEDMGGVGEEVMREFRETEERDKFLAHEVDDLNKSAESLKQVMIELSEKIDLEFKDGIKKINSQFQEFFSLMFGGGGASLELVSPPKKTRELENEMEVGSMRTKESERPESGIDISVALPRKRVKGLQMLSGGERTLTSIALLFAMSQVNPPPFLILDETDAALDESNSRKYGDMLESLSRYSQLIVVTHNRETMSRANVLYGVTMSADGISKLLSIKFDEATAIAK